MPLTALDDKACLVLRTRLEEIATVERAVVDGDSGILWLVVTPEANEPQLRVAAREALDATDLGGAEVKIEVATLSGVRTRRRVAFDSVRRLDQPGGRVQIRVQLEWLGNLYAGKAEGGTGSLVELRTAAVAATRALDELTGGELSVRVIGVKQFRAFDTELTVASLYHNGKASNRFVGTVITPENPLRGAAVAVLSALNRTLGNFLRTGE